jgi:stromal membrane-associated protein
MESFIRSKYESRRWAMEGPPPSDPSVLEDADELGQSISAPDSAAIGNGTRQPPAAEAAGSRHTGAAPAPSHASAASPTPTTRQSQPHHLLSTSHARTGSSGTATKLKPQPAVGHSVAAPTPPTAPLDELFSLDFHAPSSSSITAAREEPKKDVKQDILSLYSTPAPATGAFAPFGALQQPQLQQFQPATSMMGENGTGHWGVGSGWNNPATAAVQANVWGNPSAPPSQPSQSLGFAGNGNPWSSSPSVVSDVGRVPGIGGADLWSTSPSLGTAPQKEDAFADLWK